MNILLLYICGTDFGGLRFKISFVVIFGDISLVVGRQPPLAFLFGRRPPTYLILMWQQVSQFSWCGSHVLGSLLYGVPLFLELLIAAKHWWQKFSGWTAKVSSVKSVLKAVFSCSIWSYIKCFLPVKMLSQTRHNLCRLINLILRRYGIFGHIWKQKKQNFWV